MFLANFVPHYVYGVCGDSFPTPFSKPPGKGLSSPTINVLWALLNLAIGYLLFRVGRVSPDNLASIFIFFAGIAAMSLMAARSFHNKHSL